MSVDTFLYDCHISTSISEHLSDYFSAMISMPQMTIRYNMNSYTIWQWCMGNNRKAGIDANGARVQNKVFCQKYWVFGQIQFPKRRVSLSLFFNTRTMDIVRKLNISESYTPSSESYSKVFCVHNTAVGSTLWLIRLTTWLTVIATNLKHILEQ
jgi:hypothetical protein